MAIDTKKSPRSVAPSGGRDTEPPHWVDRLAIVMERVVPDAISTSIILLVVLFLIALAIKTPFSSALDAYYRGLWNLLAFTMQMTLILVLSLILGATPFFKKVIIALSRLPRTTTQVVIGASLCGGLVAYFNWGLSIALSPVVAIHFAKEAERKGLQVDFLFLLSTLAGVGAIWQFGLSGSAPLLMATPGHFLEKTTGIMPLSTTIWSPAAIILVISFTIACIIVGCVFMPKKVRPVSEFTEAFASVAEAPAAGGPPPGGLTFAQRLEQSPFIMAPLTVAVGSWLYLHFFVKGLSLDINAMNTLVLFLGLILHRNVYNFTKALRAAVALAWPIVVLYHLYAGVAGLIQFTPVGGFLVNMFNPLLTPYTFPLVIVVVSTVVSFFIPTSGGQWLIQGFVTVEAAQAVGATAQRGLLALSIGDHMGNLITPFWAVVGAGIARVDFRLVFGYRLIFAALWFIMGVLAFTFLPC
jgi:short-chain fatty acids transporter